MPDSLLEDVEARWIVEWAAHETCRSTEPRDALLYDRYVTVEVAYEPHLHYGRSLEWIAPELKDAGLTLTEDRTNGPCPRRTWAGLVDGRTFERFAHAFGVEDDRGEPPPFMLTEPAHMLARTRSFDGMNWEADDESPIVYVCVTVSDRPHVAQSYADRSLACTYLG